MQSSSVDVDMVDSATDNNSTESTSSIGLDDTLNSMDDEMVAAGSGVTIDDKASQYVTRMLSKLYPMGNEELAQRLVQEVQGVFQKPKFTDFDVDTTCAFLVSSFAGYIPPDMVEEFKQDTKLFVEENFPSSEMDSNPRMVAIDYKIESTKLSHTYDLYCFKDKVLGVASEWEKSRDRKKYIAPYFCFVQSSGMGKTKIMYEFAQMVNNDHNSEISCDLVVLTNSSLSPANKEKVFAKELAFPVPESVTEAREAAQPIHRYLDFTFLGRSSTLRKKQDKKRTHVILFDEAQLLLEGQFNEQAFLFRCVRVWLRSKDLKSTVVAVFAGTTSALSNYNVKDDKHLEKKTTSREHGNDPDSYYEKGSLTFKPFVCTTTIGVLNGDTGHENEYYKSIGYGRPLFATMHKHGDLESGISTVLRRILLMKKGHGKTDWEKNELSALSVLATRVQMGSSSVSITAELVAKGYANLTSVSEHETATFSYLPDPVCARLAMCMMDEGWKFACKNSSFEMQGKKKTWWTNWVKKLYSHGLCRPEKGDFGEVMVALYFLFCGDECRRANGNEEYTTFSVPLGDWIESLLLDPSTSTVQPQPPKTAIETSIDVSFIQVCRNPLRHFGNSLTDPTGSWEDFADEEFLGHLYASGTAFYLYPGCPLIDLAAPMRITKDSVVSFGALLVSIKSWNYFPPGDAIKLCSKMRAKANKNKCKSTLCLVVVFGQKSTSDYKDNTWTEKKLEDLSCGKNVSAILCLPFNDRFRLTEAFIALTNSFGSPQLLESHSFIRALSEESKKRNFSSDKLKSMLEDVMKFCYKKAKSIFRPDPK
jgi:Uncharacterized conserved protein (DUF2075)